MKKLSIRQAQIHDLLVAGLTRAQISAELGIAVGTVKTHIEKIYQKRDIKVRRELVHLEIDEAKLAIQLSPKQVQVLKGFAAGKSLPQIATEMGISLGTVQSHRRHLYKKMGVGTRAQFVAAMARNQGGDEETETATNVINP